MGCNRPACSPTPAVTRRRSWAELRAVLCVPRLVASRAPSRSLYRLLFACRSSRTCLAKLLARNYLAREGILRRRPNLFRTTAFSEGRLPAPALSPYLWLACSVIRAPGGTVMETPLLLARLLLSLVFGVSGLAKLADRVGSRQALLDFGVPVALALPLGSLL